MEERRTDTYSRAVELLQHRPCLSLTVIGRQLGVSRERIRQISEECGQGKLRRRENAVLRRLGSLQRREKISRAVVQRITTDLQPSDLSELVSSIGKRQARGKA